MIDIYDELGYIKNVLENGLSNKWERDAMLLIRYYKIEGFKKAEAKKKIKQKCLEASRKSNNPITYNPLVSYVIINKILETAWKSKTPLRTIHGVIISKEVLDWFLNLENNKEFLLSDEKVEYYKQRRPGIVIKNNKAINWNRVKYLFTLYIWTKIQENYLERPNIHYLKQYSKRFKEDANLPASFSLERERNFLFDLGVINVNHALGIETSFIDKYDVFKIPVTDQNSVFIPTGEPPYGELYNPGYWLEKKKMGSFICQRCGREFAHYGKSKGELGRKYCKECGIKDKNGQIDGEKKEVVCIDCGVIFEVSSKNTKSNRCPDCYKRYRLQYDQQKHKEYRKKEELSTDQPDS